MARCSRCNKFILLASDSGCCKSCEIAIQEEARRKAEEEQKRKEEEARRMAEEERKRKEEEALRKAEEERKRKEEEDRRMAEEERKRREEEALREAEVEQKRKEEEARRMAEKEQRRKEQEARWKAMEERERKREALRKAEVKYADILKQLEYADTFPKLMAVRENLAKFANIKFKDSQIMLEKCDSKIAVQKPIIEKKKKLEEEERKRQEEERKRLEEETRREAEEKTRKQQAKILTAFSSFPVRREVHFGDTIQEVKTKDSRTVIAQESDDTHVVFPGAVSSISGGKTYYSFDENGLLKGMSYTYYRVFRPDPYDMSGKSAVQDIWCTLLKGLKKKYGDPVFRGDALSRDIKKIKGAEYQSLVDDSDKCSGSLIWKEFGLFSEADAKASQLVIRRPSDVNLRSNNIQLTYFEQVAYFGDFAWIVPVKEDYVVIHLVYDRRFECSIKVNNELRFDVSGPFWHPLKSGYFVPAGKNENKLEMHFLDLVYVRYSADEFNQILNKQREAQEAAAKKAAEEEQRFLDEL